MIVIIILLFQDRNIRPFLIYTKQAEQAIYLIAQESNIGNSL